MGLTHDMMKGFYPMLLKFTKRYKIDIKIDCSFVPAMVYHKPPVDDLEKLAVTGCDGGNILLAVRSNGNISGCSFVANTEKIDDIEEKWHTSTQLNNFRDLVKNAIEPCKSCDYLKICRTGCRTVVIHQTGEFFGPDPECPFVVEYKNKQNQLQTKE